MPVYAHAVDSDGKTTVFDADGQIVKVFYHTGSKQDVLAVKLQARTHAAELNATTAIEKATPKQ